MATTRVPLSPTDRQSHSLEDRLKMSTAEIKLSVRTTNCLEERGIYTVGDLLQLHAEGLAEHLQFRRKDTGRSLPSPGELRVLSQAQFFELPLRLRLYLLRGRIQRGGSLRPHGASRFSFGAWNSRRLATC